MMNPYELSIKDAHEQLKSGAISSVELTRCVLDRVAAVDGAVGAYLTVDEEMAMRQAKEADARIQAGNITPLTGIPLGIKDLICTRGLKTTCASGILENFIPPYDATVMRCLYDHGAVVAGKLNMDEFAMGSSNENSAVKPCRNPWDLMRTPGGSSGGSAAAVAADMCMAALGSDTGGSIRQPASHCGVVGMKPTYGRVSRYGLVAYASSLDQIGPLAKTVDDCAIMMDAIAGFDPKDSTSVNRPVPGFHAAVKAAGEDLRGVRIGMPAEYFNAEGLDSSVQSAVNQVISLASSLGAEIVEVRLPHTKYAVAVYYVIASSEASSNLARYDGVRFGKRVDPGTGILDMYKATRSEGFGAEVKRRILIGTYALSEGYYDAYYGKAQQVRTLITRDFAAAFESCDLIISPVAPTPAFRIGEKIDDPLTMYLSDIFTLSANLGGIPGLSLPCAMSPEGLPIGVQFMGPHFSEDRLLSVAKVMETALGFAPGRPAL